MNNTKPTAVYPCGIDVGTTGPKTMIFDLDGNIIGKAYREYGCIYPKPNWVEQDIDMVFGEAVDSCREAVEKAGSARNRLPPLRFLPREPHPFSWTGQKKC